MDRKKKLNMLAWIIFIIMFIVGVLIIINSTKIGFSIAESVDIISSEEDIYVYDISEQNLYRQSLVNSFLVLGSVLSIIGGLGGVLLTLKATFEPEGNEKDLRE